MRASFFERTGQVVYTVGAEGSPAYTCQARPQEGEVFGEFPVRRELSKFTKYPVLVPTPTPAYNAKYELDHLVAKAESAPPPKFAGVASGLLKKISSPAVKGYCVKLMEYLEDAIGVNEGDGSTTGGPNRSILYGIQRPPLNNQPSVLRCSSTTTIDELAPTLVPFFVTNAQDAMEVSCDPANTSLLALLDELGIDAKRESDSDFGTRSVSQPMYNVVTAEAMVENTGASKAFPLVGQFVSLYFPMGHIKSATANDSKFKAYFSESEKWLKVRVA